MRTKELSEYIQRHKSLFWYTPKNAVENISDELLVEFIINYGDRKDIRELFNLMGIDVAAQIFRSMTGRKQLNIYPELHNYFTLYFNKYAPQHPQR